MKFLCVLSEILRFKLEIRCGPKKLSRLKLDIFVGFIMKLYDVAEILILLLDTVKHIKKLLYYHFINSLLRTYYIPKF